MIETHQRLHSRMEVMMTSPNDPEGVLRAFVAGRRDRFGEVVRAFHRRLLHYAYTILRDWEECKDVVQEAFTRLYQQCNTIRGNPQAWLFRVVRNLAIDQRRRGKRRGGSVDNITPFPDRARSNPDLKLEIEEALATLSERDRSVVVLKVVEGMSYAEIAGALGLTPSNVGYILHHGLKKLASHLREGGRS